MGCDLNDLKEWAESFKEQVWYYIDCNKVKMTQSDVNLKDKVNELLDFIDILED